MRYIGEHYFTAIIVSYNYSDFLSITLPYNKDFFDRIIVVTKSDDSKTIELCTKLGVECWCSELFNHNGAAFNRGAVYNDVLHNLKDELDWVILMDSDIQLDTGLGDVFWWDEMWRKAEDVETFYGMRRFDVDTVEKYKNLAEGYCGLNELTLFRGFGYGYFQMFNVNSSTYKNLFAQLNGHPYPESHQDCSGADWQFRNNWGDMVFDPPFDLNRHEEKNVRDYGTDKLRCLPISCLHLGETGVNWSSRISKEWKID